MLCRLSIIWFFCLVFSSLSYGRVPPGEALVTLLKSSRDFRGHFFRPHGWARVWFEKRIGSVPSSQVLRNLQKLTPYEADDILNRLLLADEGQRVLGELDEIVPHSDILLGPRTAARIWRRFFSPRQEFDWGFVLEPPNSREAFRVVRSQAMLPYSRRLRNGGVFKRTRASREETEWWVRTGGEEFPVEFVGGSELTGFSATKRFHPGREGLAAMGNRFTLSQSDTGYLFENVFNQIHVSQLRRGRFALADLKLMGGHEVVCFGEQILQNHSHLLGRFVAIAKTQRGFRLVTWERNALDRVEGVILPQRSRPLHSYELEEGALITGVRISEWTNTSGEPVIAIDYIGQSGTRTTAYFDFSNLKTVFPGEF